MHDTPDTSAHKLRPGEIHSAVGFSAVLGLEPGQLVPLPFHISPRRAAHHTDQLPDDDPGADLFTGGAP